MYRTAKNNVRGGGSLIKKISSERPPPVPPPDVDDRGDRDLSPCKKVPRSFLQPQTDFTPDKPFEAHAWREEAATVE